MANTWIDEKKRDAIFERLLQALKKKEYPYNIALLPQRKENLPDTILYGSREHALFLFAACFWMRGTRSETAFRGLRIIYEKYPGLFLPEGYPSNGKGNDGMAEIIHHVLSNRANPQALAFKSEEISRFWPLNFAKLHRFWGSDPTNLLRGTHDYHEYYHRMVNGGNISPDNPNGFWGFREKMASMFAYFIADAGMVDPSLFPVPVDFHVLRVLVSHQILVSDNPLETNFRTEAALQQVRNTVVDYCDKYGESPLALSDALWLLSMLICANNPENAAQRGKYRARKTKIVHKSARWAEQRTLRAYMSSCGSCPAPCVYNISSAEYYLKGRLKISSTRTTPPTLFENK